MKTTTQEVLDILRKFKQIRGEVYGIEKIGLFASIVRGEQQGDSDIDVCMKTRGNIDLFDLHDLRDELFLMDGRQIIVPLSFFPEIKNLSLKQPHLLI